VILLELNVETYFQYFYASYTNVSLAALPVNFAFFITFHCICTISSSLLCYIY
jgi:hypothetical protein